jgi:membrane protease YdiL (CAAX protease family)
MPDGSDLNPAAPQLGGTPPPEIRIESPSGRDLLIGVGILWTLELVIGIWAVSSGLKPEELSPAQILTTTLISAVGTCVVVWTFTCARYRRSWRQGFSILPLGRMALLWSALAGILLAVAASVVLSSMSQGKSFMAKLAARPHGVQVIYLLALLLPVVEELYYRGFIYPILSRKWGKTAAVVTVTLWFAAVHAFQLAGDWIGLPFILILSVICTVQRCKSGSLTPSIVTHWGYNGTLVAISVIQQLR